MSRVDQSLHGFADLFCLYYDEVDDVVVRERWVDWELDPDWQSLKEACRSDVQSGRPMNGVVMRVDNGDNRQRRLLAALRGMDEAFRYVNPSMKGNDHTPAGLVALEAYVAARRRLDSGANGGALIPRLVRRHDPSGEVDHKRDLFTYVQRVPHDSWNRCDTQVLSTAVALDPHDISTGLDIACVPVIAEPDEFRFNVRATATRRYYRIAPRDEPATLDRIPEIVAALDRSGALIAVAPEATLTPALLERWQEALRSRRGSRLRWVLAGTGDPRSSGQRPSNIAILLDGRTGAVIGRQHKLYPFNVSPEVLARWDLGSRLGDRPVGEDLAVVPRRVTIFDVGVARLATLICQDLDKPLDVGPLVRDLGVSHLLVPVFSRPLKPHRWEQTAAAVHLRETGTTVIVSNSLIMARILDERDPGTSLVVTPDGKGAVIGRSTDPAEPVCFRLLPDGSAELR